MTEISQETKVALITGSTGTIGRAIAKGLAQNRNYKTVLIGRNETKLKRTVDELIKETGNESVSFIKADLSLKRDIEKAAEHWQGPVDVLVNNAAATPQNRTETMEGIEMQFATNVLGYFWMTKYFLPYLKMDAPARIVNVASYWAGNLDLNDLEFKKGHYDNGSAYRQSKQANRMLTVAFSNRLVDEGITVNACHPGDVNSYLSNQLGFGGHETPQQGAETPIWLATSEEVSQVSGKYFEHKREVACQFSQLTSEIEQLYAICEAY